MGQLKKAILCQYCQDILYMTNFARVIRQMVRIFKNIGNYIVFCIFKDGKYFVFLTLYFVVVALPTLWQIVSTAEVEQHL
jgi:hypothetical protein